MLIFYQHFRSVLDLFAFYICWLNFVDDSEDEYLLNVPKKKLKLMTNGSSVPAETESDLQERADVIKQKFDQRKATKKSGNSKSERKKMKQEKLLKKQKLMNRKQTLTNELIKQEKSKKVKVKEDPDKMQSSAAIYNKEGKMFFSKIQIEGEKKRKVGDTNPQLNLQKLKAQKKKILELAGSGEKLKAKEEKEKILWKAAFEKTDGLKVKDNPDILKKTIKKRKVEKKKSKVKWNERKQKITDKQSVLQKKREDNLNKRITDKQKTKLKHAVKKGRIIKGISG